MVEVKRTVRFTTTQHVLKDIPAVQEGFPMREWTISVSLVNDKGIEVPATIFDKVTYALHPTFANPIRSFKKPPFTIQEQGWGGFDIPITLTLIEKGGDKKINHDLNFYKEKYIIDKQITINTTKSNLLKELSKSGPIPSLNSNNEKDSSLNENSLLTNSTNATTPLSSSVTTTTSSSGAAPGLGAGSVSGGVGSVAGGLTNGEKRKSNSVAGANVNDSKNVKKLKTTASKGGVDLEKMAILLTKLKEDDLLGVVQMINDNRTPEMNIKNDVDKGEFTMDLYTLPDSLLKSLWDYIKKRAE